MTVPVGRRSSSLARIGWFSFLGGIVFIFCLPVARAQEPSPASQTPPVDTSRNAPKPDAKPPKDEIASHDSAVTLKVRVNLVLVRVVVRDRNGKVVPNLKKEDFQLADNRKPQVISSFSMETPASHVVPTVTMDSPETISEGPPVKAPELAQRLVALYFDDLHLSIQDALLSRQAATKLFGAMQADERLAIFTTSGQVQQDFTADRGKLDNALQRILPRPLSQNSSTDCPPMTSYEAYQIEEVNNPWALQVAIEDLEKCAGSTPGAENIVRAAAQRELTSGESQVQLVFRNLDVLIRRISALPWQQRVIVLMSPGFFVTPSMHESSEIIDRATKANIVISSIDVRGLYVSSVYDAANSAPPSALKTRFVTEEETLQNDVLAEFSDGTGGLFYHNRNDIDQGLLQAAAEPEVSYVLGFAPQNLKLDGKYHHLKVTLINKQKWVLQARHGYFAPHGESDPEATAKEEIQQAIFSQEELHDVPIKCKTQFVKGAKGVRLFVVALLGTKELKFHKADERNKDKLTVTTAIFDENGNMLTGEQIVIDMQLEEATLERVNKDGLSVSSSFDLKPGTFLVRIVARDSEGAPMGATNRRVVIP